MATSEDCMKNKKRIFRFVLFNILYHFGVLGGFIAWSFKLTLLDGFWWIQVLIFTALINFHREIIDAIYKNIR